LVARQTRTRFIGAMIPQESKGIKGIVIFIIFYLPIIILIERSGYMRFLGKAMWFLISK
jgi:hypothetical protein